MRVKELISAMKDIIKENEGDKERCHMELDEILLVYIDDYRVTEVFESAKVWYA